MGETAGEDEGVEPASDAPVPHQIGLAAAGTERTRAALTTSCSQFARGRRRRRSWPPSRTAPPPPAARRRGAEHDDGRVLDDGVGQQPVGHLGGTPAAPAGSSAASTVKRKTLPTRTALDAFEADRGQGPFDGGALRIGDTGAQADLDPRTSDNARLTRAPRTSRPGAAR